MDTELSPEDRFELFGDFDIEGNAARGRKSLGWHRLLERVETPHQQVFKRPMEVCAR